MNTTPKTGSLVKGAVLCALPLTLAYPAAIAAASIHLPYGVFWIQALRLLSACCEGIAAREFIRSITSRKGTARFMGWIGFAVSTLAGGAFLWGVGVFLLDWLTT